MTTTIRNAGEQAAANCAPLAPPPAPATISVQAQARLNQFQLMSRAAPVSVKPGPDDVEGWRPLQEGFIRMFAPMSQPLVERLNCAQQARSLGGVPVIEVTPPGWSEDGTLVVYVHGGAFVYGTAESTLATASLAAQATGRRLISVDYTAAPRGKWQQVTDEVVQVVAALKASGVALEKIALFGDSAGASIVSGAVLKMRDRGLGMPAAVVLWSPWSDVTDAGDSHVTLRDADALMFKDFAPAANAYAHPSEQTSPYVSAVYADYTKGFPPTLIQGGTREMLLSGFIRHYQAIDCAGGTVKLDLYEGMPHVFQFLLAGTPESALALGKMDRFLRQYLPGR